MLEPFSHYGHSLTREGQGEDEDLLSIVHYGFEVIWKTQKVGFFDAEVFFFTFEQKDEKLSSKIRVFQNQ